MNNKTTIIHRVNQDTYEKCRKKALSHMKQTQSHLMQTTAFLMACESYHDKEYYNKIDIKVFKNSVKLMLNNFGIK